MTKDEEMSYDVILEERRRIKREKEKADIELYKRRANFDPMARRKASEAIKKPDSTNGIIGPPLTPMRPSKPLLKDEPEELEEEEDEIDEAAFEQAALAFIEKEKVKPSPTTPVQRPLPSRRVTVAPGFYKRSSATPLDELNVPRARSSPAAAVRRQVSSRPDALRREKLRKIIEEDEADEAEELDWDTLKAGESFEKYLSSLAKDEEDLKIRRQRAEAVRSRAQAQPPDQGTDARGASSDESGALGLEELLKLVEMVGAGDGEGEGEGSLTPPSLKSVSTTTSASRGEKGGKSADDIDWSRLEKMFLGDGWDAEIKDLAERALAAEDNSDSTLPSSSSSSVDPPAWADEVTSLLLGLVSISYERYMNKPLFDREVSEEERAEVFFKAPFALLVHDNSQEAMLEYCNEKALDLISLGSFDDIYSLSSFDVVDSSDVQQQDWLWAISEVEEKSDKFTWLPEVRFKGGKGARNVLVFRLDNLEGEAMGQAILIGDIK